MLIQRIRVENDYGNNECVGYMVANPMDSNKDFVTIGISLCHRSDRHNKKQGRELAIMRTNNYTIPYKIKSTKYFYNDIYNCILNFLGRCSAFYKDKNVILPKIKFI